MRNQQTTRPSGGTAAALAVAAACLAVSTTVTAQAPIDAEAQRILETAMEKRHQRWVGVDNYTLFQSMNGAPFVNVLRKSDGGR